MNELNADMGKNPFKVPENYFEEAGRKILEQNSGRKIPVKHLTMRKFLAAAAIAGFALLTWAGLKLFAPEKHFDLADILVSNNTELYIDDIDLLSLEQSADRLVPGEEGPEASTSDIIDYLLSENIDINEIYEHL